MALAFPKTNAVVLAPLGAAGLFWAWFGVSPKRAFWIGWLAGTVYFYDIVLVVRRNGRRA
jgi:apolipoprotein N-acyltransferase